MIKKNVLVLFLTYALKKNDIKLHKNPFSCPSMESMFLGIGAEWMPAIQILDLSMVVRKWLFLEWYSCQSAMQI